MGVNVLNARNVRRVQRVTGDPRIDRVLVWSHNESGRYAEFITSDHRHGWWDRKTNEFGYYTQDEAQHFSSCDRFVSDGEEK